MKKFKQFCTVQNPCKRDFDYDFSKVKQKFDESVADFSQFVPASDLQKALRHSKDLGTASQIFYDYKQGEKFDGNYTVPIGRIKGLDRAELSQYKDSIVENGSPIDSKTISFDHKDTVIDSTGNNSIVSDSTGSNS